MNKIIIKDIENLKQQKEQIIELQKKIEALDEIKLLQEKTKQKEKLILKIKKLSIYDANTIGNVIAKLMSEFEGVLYQCTEDNLMGRIFEKRYDYIISPKVIRKGINDIYPSYQLKKYKLEDRVNSDIFPIHQVGSLTFLSPSSFESKNIFSLELRDNDIFYIQYFIDFLYEKRSNHLLYEVSSEYLEMALQEFLFITKDLQRQRKQEIKLKMKEWLSYEKRRIFEKSCMIDRILIYNALMYIANNYENNIVAFQESKGEWQRSMQWCWLYGYHNLIIKEGEKQFLFQSEVDRDGCYPDEEDCARVNLERHTKICFFDLKKTLLPITSRYQYIEMFMIMLEKLYDEKKNILADDIQSILVLISNDRKEKKKFLRTKHQEISN